ILFLIRRAVNREQQRLCNEKRLGENNINIVNIRQHQKMNKLKEDQDKAFMLLTNRSKNIEQRKGKIRRLFEEERNEYCTEMQVRGALNEQHSSVKELKKKLEKIRSARKEYKKKYVAEKMREIFLRDSVEYRDLKNEEHEKILGKAHEIQIQENKEKKLAEKERDALFYRLYMDDYEMKRLRELDEENKRRVIVQDVTAKLKRKLAELDKKRREQPEVSRSQGKEVRAEMEMEKKEKAKELEEKFKKQEYMRNQLKYQMDVKKKINEKKQAINDALEFKVLNDAHTKHIKENEENRKRILEERYEAQRFREWKTHSDKLRNDEEKAMDEEIMKHIDKQVAERRRIHENNEQKRHSLMQQVICGRKMQIRHKNSQKEKEKIQNGKFFLMEKEKLDLTKEREIREMKQLTTKKHEVRKDLEEQIQRNLERKKELDRKKVLEFECLKEADKEYLERVKYEAIVTSMNFRLNFMDTNQSPNSSEEKLEKMYNDKK
ncbi:hypothetical protein SNEBB_006583, partial [Seison nebaliae]